jgi:tRNA (guanosine-2'-O-)-methyltransferase
MAADLSPHKIDAEEEMEALLDAGGTPPVAEDPFVVDDRQLAPDRIIQLLAPFLTDRRRSRIREVVAQRTRTVVPVVEGLVNTGNVSAVMRSTEALGYQDLHVVKGDNERYKHSKRTAQGAQHWLDVWRWAAPEACVDHLHDRGYRVLTMDLRPEARPVDAIDFTEPTALVFGNEDGGVSDAFRAAADGTCIIPLGGFTESFNVSVAAAIALYHARQDRLQRQGAHADLSEAAQTRLVARFYRRSVGNATEILRRRLRDDAAARAGD